MSWRTLFFANPCKLSLDKDRLQIDKEGDRTYIPIDDIAVIILESHQIILTNALLSRLAENKTAIFTCGEIHTPNGLFLPFAKHSRLTQIANMQISWSMPFRKRCWKEVVKTKIANQAKVLDICGRKNGNKLMAMMESVDSGDSKNIESSAAMIYFLSLFDDFDRGMMCLQNSALNYGYAILRGVVARSLVAYGFVPFFGLHHKSELNAYNLADDLLEPFRAMIDKEVFMMFGHTPQDECDIRLNIEQKAKLVDILNSFCLINSEQTNILNACEVVAESLQRATKAKDYELLRMPILL